jgi:hypothetical protein
MNTGVEVFRSEAGASREKPVFLGSGFIAARCPGMTCMLVRGMI